ncbi:hypothetical protein [Prosthecomicrobium sp. N25]|uniref:hypothetical protein n=1 Tax=Prosthecomicrobium sp. N25 TaxID=3129254 RepID=UPI00307742E8
MKHESDFGSAVPPDGAPLPDRVRGFLLLHVFVLAQHGYVDRASTILEALHALGDAGADVVLGRAVMRFFRQDWPGALACLDELDRIDPIERFGQYRMTERQRMRRYVKARCLFELGDGDRARDAVESYLRHGTATGPDER